MEIPECEKLAAISHLSDACYNFVEWLNDNGMQICRYDSRRDRCDPISKTTEALLYEYFGIDAKKLDAERRALLDSQRELNASQR